MPPKPSHTTEQILSLACNYVKTNGIENLNARSLAKCIGVSTTPILRNFGTMESLKSEVLKSLKTELDFKVIEIHKTYTLSLWMARLCAMVIQSWLEPLAAKAIRGYFWGQDGSLHFDEYVETMKMTPVLRTWNPEKLRQGAFRSLVYTAGMVDYAAQGYLYQPSELGIILDMKDALSKLLLGGNKNEF